MFSAHAHAPRRQPRLSALAALLLTTLTAAPTLAAVPDYGDAPRGFYQLLLHEGQLYAAFTGTLGDLSVEPITYALATTPGAVFVFDPDTLALREEIPLVSASAPATGGGPYPRPCPEHGGSAHPASDAPHAGYPRLAQ